MLMIPEAVKFYAGRVFNKLFKDESGEVNVVAIVILIGIAIVLALLFKTQITSILNRLLGSISDKADQAIS